MWDLSLSVKNADKTTHHFIVSQISHLNLDTYDKMAKHLRNKAWRPSANKTKKGPSQTGRSVLVNRRPKDKRQPLEDLVQQLQKELEEQKEKTEAVKRRNDAFRKEVRWMKQELKKALNLKLGLKSGTTNSRFRAAPKNSFVFQKQHELDRTGGETQSPPNNTFQETSEVGQSNNMVCTDFSATSLDNSGFYNHRNLASGADIIALACSLNSEILHAATIITETCLTSSCVTSSDEDVESSMKAREQTQITLGIDLVHALTSQCDSQNIISDLGQTLLQIAMQAAMVTFCVNVIQNSSFSQADEKQNMLSQVYENIREQGGS